MDIEVTYRGDRIPDLIRLNRDRNNTELSKWARRQADEAMQVIIKQMEDKKLVSLREQLVRATRAEDTRAAIRIQMRIREHMKEPLETGEYEDSLYT